MLDEDEDPEDFLGSGKKIKDEVAVHYIDADNESEIIYQTQYDVPSIMDNSSKPSVPKIVSPPPVELPLQVAQVQEPSALLVRMKNIDHENLVLQLIKCLEGSVAVLPSALTDQ